MDLVRTGMGGCIVRHGTGALAGQGAAGSGTGDLSRDGVADPDRHPPPATRSSVAGGGLAGNRRVLLYGRGRVLSPRREVCLGSRLLAPLCAGRESQPLPVGVSLYRLNILRQALLHHLVYVPGEGWQGPEPLQLAPHEALADRVKAAPAG